MIEVQNEIGIVISRYYEDLRWVEQIKAPYDVYIYNRKGESPPETGVPSAIRTPINSVDCKDKNEIGNLNVETVKNNGVNINIIEMVDDLGYEASTFAQHCHSRHDALNDYTVFLQGHPEVYVENIITKLNDPYRLLHTKYIPQNTGPSLIPPCEVLDTREYVNFQYLSDKFGWLDPAQEYCWSWYYPCLNVAPWWEFVKDHPDWTENCSKPMSSFPFGAGMQFIACKKRLLRHDPDYYRRIQRFTQTYVDPHTIRPNFPCPKNCGPGAMEAIFQFAF